MTRQRWSFEDIPAQHGRTALVTGASTGLGFAIADALARRGADVVLACRDASRAAAAADRIWAGSPGAVVRTLLVDFASLASVRAAARRLHDEYDHLDLLVNNVGGFRVRYAVTEDGFESTIAVNHLGPFAFTGLVLNLLTGTAGSRAVTVGSNGHRQGTIEPAGLDPEPGRAYRFMAAYNRAKLANLLFAHELDRRLRAARAPTIAVAGHPGLARTEGGREMNPLIRAALNPKINPLALALSQTAARGALGPLRAATDPHARGGDYFGPRGRTGYPELVTSSALSHDIRLQRRLWEASERLTGVTYLPLQESEKCS
ncbi:oxidoreductase [Amycolatopsis jiangsuensis]|uniref:NAD(P)-dependent dehydrogenase (Short-subunit alcohol dehydrogenase family) n=1 Tax=Amycolatopsis jiangsuensis TaxID=1181879 RepID=A0A840ISF8_9PSEU|nr:oxidoreductase [Amycolatopsis jiangsuensis]MBB4684385.1 NAD(P)-dependent dehydrogenase (short-subunit alcohol dehydrogenase family) [Amycolatopsis jiangsuensis]